MPDNTPIFDTIRPWLDSNGFNAPGRIDALNAACDRFRANPSNAIIFEEVRDWLDRRGFTDERVAALDAACNQLRDAAAPFVDAVDSMVDAILGPAAPEKPATAPSPPAAPHTPAPAPTGENLDRYLAVFRHLASPQAKPADVQAMARSFAAHAPAYGQDRTKPRIAEFVAQIANETGGFRVFNENLNYSASRMMQVWGKRIRAEAAKRGISAATLAAQLDRKPEAIANVVYQRAEMGNTRPGDGWRYRGRGALQLTFRANYKLFGQRLGIDLEGNPDLASDPAVSVQIALEFFKVGKVNAAIDRGDFREARRITNGAALGLEEVARLRARALAVL